MSWPLVKLGDVATVINGRAYNKDELLPAGKYPVLRVGNFFSNRDWYYSDLELDAKNYCDTGDLLYAWSASFGPKIWDEGKVIYHYHIWKLVLNEDKVDKKYLFYFLQRDVGKIKQEHGAGSTMIHITKGAMEERLISLPPLEEQKRIAAILDKADAIRRKRQQAIKLADDFLRSVFLEMFGDPVTNPKGWDVCNFESLGKWSSGGTPSRTKPEYFDGDIDWYSAGELNHRYLSGSVEKITEAALAESAAKLFPAGSLLMGMYDTAAMKISILSSSSSSNQACASFIPSEKVDIEWFFTFIEMAKEHYLLQRRGVRQKNLNLGMIKEFELPLPPISAQKEFSKIVKKVISIKSMQGSGEKLSCASFTSISQKAFSGNL